MILDQNAKLKYPEKNPLKKKKLSEKNATKMFFCLLLWNEEKHD